MQEQILILQKIKLAFTWKFVATRRTDEHLAMYVYVDTCTNCIPLAFQMVYSPASYICPFIQSVKYQNVCIYVWLKNPVDAIVTDEY